MLSFILVALCLGGVTSCTTSASRSSADLPTLPNVRIELEILKVFSARDGDFAFRAYLVEWEGQEVILYDDFVLTSHEKGDKVRIRIRRHPNASQYGAPGLLKFALIDLPLTHSEDSPAASNRPPPAPRLSLKIQKVFSARDGDYVFRAYLAKWKGQEIIIRDGLATTNYRAGKQVEVMVHYIRGRLYFRVR